MGTKVVGKGRRLSFALSHAANPLPFRLSTGRRTGGKGECFSHFLAVYLVAQSTIMFSAMGDMVSSMSLYSFGLPVVASCKR